MKSLTISLFLVVSFLLVGCTSVPMASMEEDSRAKSFVPVEAKSTIYIFRNENFGGAIKMPVLLDNKLIGDTAAKTYILAVVEPGEHTLLSKTENDSSLTLTTNASEIYYVWQEVKMGVWSARSELQLVDEELGKKGVLESKLVK